LGSLRLSLFLAAVAVLLRPTNLLIWTPILLLTIRPSFIFGHELQELMLKYRMGKKIYDSDQLHALLELRDLRTPEILILAREVILCGSMALGFSVGADRIYFGDWAFPPYKWLYFNISQSLAVFYGRNPWHYYLFQGVPLLCTTLVPFLLMSFFTKQAIELRILRWAVYFTVVTLSLISHKEVRFIYPLLPLLHLIAAQPVANFFLSPAPPSQAKPASKSSLNLKNHTYLFAGLFINILLASYLGAFHQGAPLSVLTFLRTRYATTNQNDDRLFALFLMPCHSTPWRSHLVYPHLTARALTCEPPLHTLPGTTERETYRDEADRFYDDPLGFLGREVWPLDDASTQQTVPRYVVGFEGIHPWLEEFFASTAAKETLGDVTLDKVWEGWNGFFNEDWRRGGRMVVWEASVSSS
jgi:phosphatidylinositol glycan class B